MSDERLPFVDWLEGMAAQGGKGVIDNIDARSLGRIAATIRAQAARIEALTALICSDCPPVDYPTDKTRCAPCPRRVGLQTEEMT